MAVRKLLRRKPIRRRFFGQEEREVLWTTDGDVDWEEINAIRDKFPVLDEYHNGGASIYLVKIFEYRPDVGAYWLMVAREEGEDYITSYRYLEEAKEAFEETKKEYEEGW